MIERETRPRGKGGLDLRDLNAQTGRKNSSSLGAFKVRKGREFSIIAGQQYKEKALMSWKEGTAPHKRAPDGQGFGEVWREREESRSINKPLLNQKIVQTDSEK